MYAQVVFTDGLDCAGCGQSVFPHGKPTVGQIVDPQSGLAALVPDAKSEEAKGHYLEARCKCGTSTRIVLDGISCRIERQGAAPVVRDPIYLI
jgi:hypothetical protein